MAESNTAASKVLVEPRWAALEESMRHWAEKYLGGSEHYACFLSGNPCRVIACRENLVALLGLENRHQCARRLADLWKCRVWSDISSNPTNGPFLFENDRRCAVLDYGEALDHLETALESHELAEFAEPALKAEPSSPRRL